MSLAQALAVANRAALSEGTVPDDSLISIDEESFPSGNVWCIQYGPRAYINKRGGDLIVMIDQRTNSVQQILYGQ